MCPYQYASETFQTLRFANFNAHDRYMRPTRSPLPLTYSNAAIINRIRIDAPLSSLTLCVIFAATLTLSTSDPAYYYRLVVKDGPSYHHRERNVQHRHVGGFRGGNPSPRTYARPARLVSVGPRKLHVCALFAIIPRRRLGTRTLSCALIGSYPVRRCAIHDESAWTRASRNTTNTLLTYVWHTTPRELEPSALQPSAL